MQPSMLEEISQVPNPYPIVSEMQLPEVWQLCQQARDLAWDPTRIDYSDLRDANLPDEVRRARAEWGSLPAWREPGAAPSGPERARATVAPHRRGARTDGIGAPVAGSQADSFDAAHPAVVLGLDEAGNPVAPLASTEVQTRPEGQEESQARRPRDARSHDRPGRDRFRVSREPASR